MARSEIGSESTIQRVDVSCLKFNSIYIIFANCFKFRVQKKQTSGGEAHIFLGAEQSSREVDCVFICDEDPEVSLYHSSSISK